MTSDATSAWPIWSQGVTNLCEDYPEPRGASFSIGRYGGEDVVRAFGRLRSARTDSEAAERSNAGKGGNETAECHLVRLCNGQVLKCAKTSLSDGHLHAVVRTGSRVQLAVVVAAAAVIIAPPLPSPSPPLFLACPASASSSALPSHAPSNSNLAILRNFDQQPPGGDPSRPSDLAAQTLCKPTHRA